MLNLKAHTLTSNADALVGYVVALASVGFCWLLYSRRSAKHQAFGGPERTVACGGSQGSVQKDEHAPAGKDMAAVEHLAGMRVQFHGLRSSLALNESYGIVVRKDEASGRLVVRKEIALATEAVTVTVKASNLRTAAHLDHLKALQELVDSLPSGARLTLARGTVRADSIVDEPSTVGAATASSTLMISSAITLTGMGSRSGGTVLGFDVCVGPNAVGVSVELAGLHVDGQLEISPTDVQRLRVCRVSVTAPEGKPAIIVDEISRVIPPESEADGRVLLEDCWIRKGTVGVMINAVGCRLRRCRIQGAGTYGIRANATFAIEGTRLAAHRAVLSVRSTYFRSMLKSNCREAQPRAVIQVGETAAAAFRLLLAYLHTDALDDLDDEVVIDVMRKARE